MKFIDPSTQRKNNIVSEKLTTIDNFPLFSIVEFNIYGRCNRECSFCPVSDKSFYKATNEKLEIKMYEKIIKDLQNIDYQGKILYSAFCEPLLHKEVEKLIEISKRYLPKSRVEIVTNGDLLSMEKLKKLFEYGLDTISISMYDGECQKEYFTKMKNELALKDEQFILRRRYFDGQNYGITISNRSGLIDSNLYRDKNEKQITTLPLNENCYYPFYMTLIDLNGDMLLCPHDWRKSIVLGNLKDEHIFDIWRGEKINSMRNILASKSRNFVPCRYCDVIGKLMGRESFEAWEKNN